MSEIVTRQAKINNIRSLLTSEGVKAQIAMVAPKHLTPERITRIAMTSIQRTPKLLECTQESLLGALLTCTQLGLEPDSVSGRAYLIPYGKNCQLIVGYRGLMELARRSGEIQTLDARVVYKHDDFDFAFGATPVLRHKPTFLTHDRGDVVAAYAVAIMRNGASQFEVMSRDEIEGIRKRSQAGNDGPWVTDWNEMARKTVMRRLCKYLPSSPELSQAVTLDEQAERGIPQDLAPIDVDVSPGTEATAGPRKPRTLDDVAAEDELRQSPEPQPVSRPAPAPPPPPPNETMTKGPPPPAPISPADQQEAIGMKSELYQQISLAYGKLPAGIESRATIRAEMGVKLITDVAKMRPAAALAVLAVIENWLANVTPAGGS